jgi:hypothetical protein
MPNNTKTNRKPKFRRVPLEKPLLLTQRDLAIFDALERYRFLTSDLICRLIQGSPDKIRRRLQLLFHDSYIDRPEVQIKLYQPTTNDPFIYALSSKGAQALQNYGITRIVMRGLTNRNKTSGRPYIQHSLAIAEVITAFEHAAREDFISQIKFSHQSEASRAPHWRVMADTPDQPEMLGVVPDHAFGLRSMENKTNYLFLEADNGTMPVTRSGPRQTSLLQKIRAYLASNAARIPQQMFGIPAFRVLFVLPNQKRLNTLLKTIETETEGRGARLFLLTTFDALKSQDPLTVPLINGRGEKIFLGVEE